MARDPAYLRLLGAGACGKVYLAEDASGNGPRFAVKTVKTYSQLVEPGPSCRWSCPMGCACTAARSLASEVAILKAGNDHRFVCGLIRAWRPHPGAVHIAMQLGGGGDLMNRLQAARGALPHHAARFYLAEIGSGVAFLHSKGFLYRDLSLTNTVLTAEGHVLLVDFGTAKHVGVSGTTKTLCGTPEFIAPEVLLGKAYGHSADCWAYGVLAFQLLLGRPPFWGKSTDEIFKQIVDAEPSYPQGKQETLLDGAAELLDEFLVKAPRTRLTITSSKYRSLEFFEGIDWDQVESALLPPPFVPTATEMVSGALVDQEFQGYPSAPSPVDPDLLADVNPECFASFDTL